MTNFTETCAYVKSFTLNNLIMSDSEFIKPLIILIQSDFIGPPPKEIFVQFPSCIDHICNFLFLLLFLYFCQLQTSCDSDWVHITQSPFLLLIHTLVPPLLLILSNGTTHQSGTTQPWRYKINILSSPPL